MHRACKHCRKELVAYHDGELSERVRQRVSEHLDRCADCRTELDALRTALALLAAPPEIEPSADYDRRFWDKIRHIRTERAENRARLADGFWRLLSRRSALAGAAALAVCVCLATLIAVRSPRQPSGEELVIAQNIDLFENLEIIEKSEALEQFELISVLDAFAKDESQ